ncbi:MAG: FliM/FliN family flagellar motor switch protein [Sedimentisphaerales bacterium]|jgi:flagellar motor switch protein FliN/FliY|nr:FliM/FliN family flagellar motor switch protein [Sedimentisphaerales bacterium]NLT77712.1 FliM/FliN family flagellar motor switch protein [Planctomycetota bacterium]
MPETAEAPTQNESQQLPADDRTRAQSVEFPQAPEGEAAASTGQLDILLDMDVPVTVALGTTEVPVRRLLQLGPGAVLKLEKPIEAPVDLYLKDSKFAEAEVVVVDNRFAVRIKTITGAGGSED